MKLDVYLRPIYSESDNHDTVGVSMFLLNWNIVYRFRCLIVHLFMDSRDFYFCLFFLFRISAFSFICFCNENE